MATETATASKVEKPKIPTDLNSTPPNIDDTPPLSGVGGGGELKGKPVEKTTTGDEGGDEVTDVKKKMKRAERFGVPIHLSEREKRNSRAERFGTGAAGNGVDSSKQSEEVKKKARAERFGTAQSDSAEEESKKKARLARFGSAAPIDPAEEEKKKARALRFSQPSPGSKTNGKGNAETKTAIAGSTGGGI